MTITTFEALVTAICEGRQVIMTGDPEFAAAVEAAAVLRGGERPAHCRQCKLADDAEGCSGLCGWTGWGRSRRRK